MDTADLKRAAEYFLRLLFPPKCIFCGEILTIACHLEICRICYDKLPFTSDSFLAAGAETGSSYGCTPVICLCHYSGLIRDSLRDYKFNDKPSYYRALAGMLHTKVKRMTSLVDFDIIISVPLHKKREQKRGYNQSALLSRHLAGLSGIPDMSRAVARMKNTDEQSRLNKDKRAFNVKGAFKVLHPELVKDKRILLIDDITTTGNTLDECSKVLRTAGSGPVTAAVIASGRGNIKS